MELTLDQRTYLIRLGVATAKVQIALSQLTKFANLDAVNGFDVNDYISEGFPFHLDLDQLDLDVRAWADRVVKQVNEEANRGNGLLNNKT